MIKNIFLQKKKYYFIKRMFSENNSILDTINKIVNKTTLPNGDDIV